MKRFLTVLALGLGASWGAAPAAAAAPFAPLSSEVAWHVADWVGASGDSRGLPFAIVDKATAEIFVFGPDGRLLGVAPVLLGLAPGDDSAPGIGDRELADIRPEERTTPAGRFLAGYGPAKGWNRVLWVDYATAVSLHRVVTANPRERRLERLQSPSPDDNRITYGCINVAADFYDEVVRPAFAGTEGVFYILPETRPLHEAFPGFPAHLSAAAGWPDSLHAADFAEAP